MRIGIVGAGIFGIAAALELRERGHEVVAFEQGQVPNERASSTDVSKTIRRAYADKAHYVELAERAAPVWRKWHEQLGRQIYFQVGQLQIESHFEPGSRVYESYEFFRRRGDDVRLLPVDEARGRFPQFRFGDGDSVVFDGWAGYLASGQAVGDLASLARANGVVIRTETKVDRVVDEPTHATIVLLGEEFVFDRAVIAAGPWIGQLIPFIGRTFRPTFQQMAFFDPPDHELFAPGPMPVWSVEIEEEGWYGHPLKAQGWLKVAGDLLGPIVEPDVPRQATPEFLAAAEEFVARRMPSLAGHLVGSRACVYENTPDRDFVIDWVPGSQRILAAGGGSGHGFKFGGSIGPVIADALEDKANRIGDLFRMGNRFS